MATTPLNTPIPSIEELTQNIARLLQQQLADAAQAMLAAGHPVGAVDLDLARSNVRALAFVLGASLHGAYRYQRDYIARQAIPNRAAGVWLDGWLQTYGMARKPAGAAAGTATGKGVDGTTLPSGTLLQTSDGRQYTTTQEAVVVGTGVSAPVTALQPGAAGNLGAGATLTLVSPVAGVDARFETLDGLAGGADLESDEEAAWRLQQRLSAEPMGGAPADYARWALAVPGITRAWGLRNPAGHGTAGVLCMADGNAAPGLPTPAQLASVRAYIEDPRRGPPDELVVLAPTVTALDFELAVSPDTPEIRAGVEQALADLFAREAVPGGSIPHSHVIEALSAVVGEYNHEVIAPTLSSGALFTVGGYDELLALGTVTWA